MTAHLCNSNFLQGKTFQTSLPASAFQCCEPDQPDVLRLREFQKSRSDENLTIALWLLKMRGAQSRLVNTGPPSKQSPGERIRGIGGGDAIGRGLSNVRWRRLFLTADVQYFIRMRGDFDYRFGN